MDWAYSSSCKAEQHSEMLEHTFNILGLPYSVFTWACMFPAVFLPIVLKISKAAFQYNCLKKIWPEKQEEKKLLKKKNQRAQICGAVKTPSTIIGLLHIPVLLHTAQSRLTPSPIPRPHLLLLDLVQELKMAAGSLVWCQPELSVASWEGFSFRCIRLQYNSA